MERSCRRAILLRMSAADHSLARALNGFAVAHDGIADLWMAYVRGSEALFLVGVIVLLLCGLRSLWCRRAGVLAGLGAAIGLAVAVVLAGLVDRARPFVDDPSGIHRLVPHAADPGFPSDHATAAFAIATAVLLHHRGWGIAAMVAAVALAAGRVAAGVHFPGDVLAGAAIGVLATLLVHASPLRAPVERLADGVAARLPGRTAAAA
jgi:undecaprenyl-diphosphatase